jgi:hypothetical protein
MAVESPCNFHATCCKECACSTQSEKSYAPSCLFSYLLVELTLKACAQKHLQHCGITRLGLRLAAEYYDTNKKTKQNAWLHFLVGDSYADE